MKPLFFWQSLVKIIYVLQLYDLLVHEGVPLHVLAMVVLSVAARASRAVVGLAATWLRLPCALPLRLLLSGDASAPQLTVVGGDAPPQLHPLR
jgi:hypothetical protein